MNAAIVDPTEGIDAENKGMGARYLEWDCARNKIDVTGVGLADIILATGVSMDCLQKLRKLRKLTNKKIVIGGPVASYPASIKQYADYFCVGDGQKVIEHIGKNGTNGLEYLENVYVKGKTGVKFDSGFPWDMPYMKGIDGVHRVWLGRGCKKKCTFCSTGWGQEFSEAPDYSRAIRFSVLAEKSKNKVAYLTNDILQHPKYVVDKLQIAHTSLSMDYLKRNGVPDKLRLGRFGIEAPSEFMRDLISKPLSNQELVNITQALMQKGITVRWFMIGGLYGESDVDYEELFDVIKTLSSVVNKSILEISFTAFCTQPDTPMGACRIDDLYYDRIKELYNKIVHSKRVSNHFLVRMPRMPKARDLEASLYMCKPISELKSESVSPDWGENSRIINYAHSASFEKAYYRIIRKANSRSHYE